jgi:methyl-accepting chemotaxis protein
VTDIMGEISAASNEQSLGVSQIAEAIGSMDQTTQQNAALVEEMAAAASSLKQQAQELVQTVAIFKLADGPVASGRLQLGA